MVLFPLIDCKIVEMAFVLSLQSSYNRNSPKKDPTVTKYWSQKEN